MMNDVFMAGAAWGMEKVALTRRQVLRSTLKSLRKSRAAAKDPEAKVELLNKLLGKRLSAQGGLLRAQTRARIPGTPRAAENVANREIYSRLIDREYAKMRAAGVKHPPPPPKPSRESMSWMPLVPDRGRILHSAPTIPPSSAPIHRPRSPSPSRVVRMQEPTGFDRSMPGLVKREGI